MWKILFHFMIIFTVFSNLSASEIIEVPLLPSKVSGDGYVIAGRCYYDERDAEYGGDFFACRWSEADGLGVVRKPYYPGYGIGADALGIDFDGSVIVGWSNSNLISSFFIFSYGLFIWQRDAGIYYPELPPDDAGNSALSVSADGTKIIIGQNLNGGSWIQLWGWSECYLIDTTEDTVKLIPPPDDTERIIGAEVSADGLSLVVNAAFQDSDYLETSKVFKWNEADGYQYICEGEAADVSADGSIIVGSSEGQAFRYVQGSGLQNIGGFTPTAANADCSMIVGSTSVWDETSGLRSIEDHLLDRGIDVASEGWTITSVSDISDDGSLSVRATMEA